MISIMKRTPLSLLAALCILPLWAGKPKTLPRTIRNYPSGIVDEYHFRPGYIVVRGRVENVPAGTFGTLQLTGANIFTEKDFVETIPVDSTGRFCASVLVPHSQFFTLGFDGMVFAAVGDTLDITVKGITEFGEMTMSCSGTGATGEVNRVWPQLRRQFRLDRPSEKPWEAGDRQVMMDWRKRKLDEFRSIARAIDADTISLMDGCSDFARDVLKSSLLAQIPEDIGSTFHQYWWRSIDENRQIPPEKRISRREIWDFLSECEPYLLDNPCILLAEYADRLVNALEFGPLDAYMYLSNEIESRTGIDDSEQMSLYKVHYVLPAVYDGEEHRNMLEVRNGRLLSVAEYYRMATDTMCTIYGLHNNFMMQVCLAHEVLRDAMREMGVEQKTEDWFLHAMAERLAGAIPQFTDKLVAQRVVDTYRHFVAEKEGLRPEPSLSPEGDSIFNALVERYRGNVLVMDFWGMSCAPCRAGMLRQREDVEYFREKPVRFLYICNEMDSPREPSERWMNDNGIRGEHIFLTKDEWNHLVKKFQFLGIPFHVTVDRRGRVVSKYEPHRVEIEELLK